MKHAQPIRPLTRTTAASPWSGLAGLVLLLSWSLSGAVLADDQFPDDHGDDPAGAGAITVGGAAINGNIEMEVDADYFTFMPQQGKEYTVTATENSVPDLTVRIRSQAGAVLQEASSVGGSQAQFSWYDVFAVSAVYIEVNSFAQFTNGTYSVQVTEQELADTDADDLPDLWEVEFFGNLSEGKHDDYDGDGLSNYDEYLLGSDPTQGSVGDLVITSFTGVGGDKVLTWDSVPLRVYQVQTVESIYDTWQTIGSVTGQSAQATFTDVNADPTRCYRVILQN